MSFMGLISSAAMMLLNWNIIFYIILGLFIGVWVGAVPGISASLAISVMLAPSYYMQPLEAIIFLTAIYTGGIYAGSISAILLNIPGSPGAVATVFDGYEMSKKGLHNEALGTALGSSVFGCFAGYIAVLFLFIPIARIVLYFGPAEMLMLVVFALTAIGVVRGDLLKTFIGGILGVLLAMAGPGPVSGASRGVFKLVAFWDGIPRTAAIIGMLAIRELFNMVERGTMVDVGVKKKKKNMALIVKSMFIPLKYKFTMLRSAVVGIVVGLLPAAGTTMAALLSWGLTQRYSKNSDSIGKGNPEGVVACEVANNAAEGGAIATTLAFGIPGSGACAILMGALLIHGLTPGPYLIKNHAEFTYAIIIGNILQSLFLIAVGLLFIYLFSDVIFVPTQILAPAIIIVAFFGVLTINKMSIDLIVLLIFGILGACYVRLGYPILSLVLGFVIGGTLEQNLVRVILSFDGRYLEIFIRPIVQLLLGLTVLGIIAPPIVDYFKKKKELAA